jgi:hypothetical protein
MQYTEPNRILAYQMRNQTSQNAKSAARAVGDFDNPIS